MDKKTWSVEIVPINGPDGLRETTRGSDVEIVQLKPGKLVGAIKHFGVGNLVVTLGRFSSEVRMRGTLHQEKIVLGTILDSGGISTQWWKDVQVGDVGVFPAGGEFDAIHAGRTAYLTVSIALPDLLSLLGDEDHLSDPGFWNTNRLCNSDPSTGAEMLQRLTEIISGIECQSTAPSDRTADFVQRSIIESFVMGLTNAVPANAPSYTGARLVTETEDYIDAAGGRPVHISELCSALKVSRRGLHRAFTHTLGIGPAAYLRRRRLSTIRSILSRRNTATISIGDLAFEYGFPQDRPVCRLLSCPFWRDAVRDIALQISERTARQMTTVVVELAQTASCFVPALWLTTFSDSGALRWHGSTAVDRIKDSSDLDH